MNAATGTKTPATGYFFTLPGATFRPMTCSELKALVAERRESYGKVLQSILTEMMDRYGCTGINKTDLYSFPAFSQHPTPADIHRLACAYSDMAHLSSNILDVCNFIAPSGRRISITQTVRSENVALNIRTDGELSENDRTATERFIIEELHLELGRRVSGSTGREEGTQRWLWTDVTYCENDLYGRRRKAVKRAPGKNAKAASA
jgi:hypothetical protein